MYTYALLPSVPPMNQPSTFIKRIGDDGTIAFVPTDEGNSDYQAYLAWLASGNVPDPADN